ncbi:MAG: DNA repair protein RecO [Clostridia bacterium 62_21]|nr:MAG: DNA repair protein RecO [Clostridia bacterium 62_21]
MRLFNVEAVVLRAHAVREADRLLVLLSRERGKLRAMAYGAAKPASKKRGAVQPFTHGRYLLAAGRELYTVRQAEEITSWPSFYGDLVRLAYASYAAELADAFLPEEHPGEGAFRLFFQFLQYLAVRVDHLVLRLFEARLLFLAGFWPQLAACATCTATPGSEVFFSPRAGGILCRACGEKDPEAFACRRGTLRLLGALQRWPFERLASLRVDAAGLDELGRVLHAAVCYHLEQEPKTLRFLRRLENEVKNPGEGDNTG